MNASVATLAETGEAQDQETRHQRLPSPVALREALPLETGLQTRIRQQRQAVRAILNGEDDRLLVITGPCSLHDPESALEYGQRLAGLAEQVSDSLLLVMRAYVEKPRTTVGWKGLLYDPHLDGRHDLATGLRLSRELLRDLARLGLPLATELLNPLAASYLSDLLAWAAIGARTTESQIHREMVSGLPLPVGFKNGTDGSVTVARDAMGAAAHGHTHLGLDDHGHPALVQTPGNADTHLVLRGGHQGPNYQEEQVLAARDALESAGLNPRLVVDCSHANSGKDPARQPLVLEEVLRQRRQGDSTVVGVMLESHLNGGNQPLSESLRYGVSVTDACLSWADTEARLLQLARE